MRVCYELTGLDVNCLMRGQLSPVATKLKDASGNEFSILGILTELRTERLIPSRIRPASGYRMKLDDGTEIARVTKIYVFDSDDNPHLYDVPDRITLVYTEPSAKRCGWAWRNMPDKTTWMINNLRN